MNWVSEMRVKENEMKIFKGSESRNFLQNFKKSIFNIYVVQKNE